MMQLQDLFLPVRIKVPLEAEDKEEVFEEMTDLLVTTYGLSARNEILSALYERERKMSTGIKTGIAMPHGKTRAVDSLYGVLGISKTGIEYESLDGKPVYLVFMLISSPEKTEAHLRILQKLALLLENPDFFNDLTHVDRADEACAVIRKYEEILGYQE